MLQTRIQPLRLLALSFAFSAIATADELDPITVIEPDAPAASAPMDRALRPLEWLLRTTHPTFTYSYARAKGVLSAPGITESTTVQTAAISLYSNLGQFATLQYRPSWTHYSSEAFDNTFGQEAGLSWRRGFIEWNFRAAHRYSKGSVPLIETGRQTSQETHTTSLEAQRPLGPRSTLELGLRQRIRDAETFSGNRLWSTDNWLHYQISSAIGASGGVAAGYAEADDGANMRYTQVNGRFRWHIGERLRADFRAGVESRKFVESDRDNANTPVYGAQLIYRLLETTTVTLAADQSVFLSYFSNQVHRTSTWQVGLSQRLLGRLHLELAYVLRDAAFSATDGSTAVDRHDDGRSFRADLRTTFLRRGTFSVFYQDKRNRSTDLRFDFRGRQIGAEVSLRY